MRTDNENEWNCFYKSGKVDDYLNYVNAKTGEPQRNEVNADKSQGNSAEASEYR